MTYEGPTLLEGINNMFQRDADLAHPSMSTLHSKLFTEGHMLVNLLKGVEHGPDLALDIFTMMIPQIEPMSKCSLTPNGVCGSNGREKAKHHYT